MKKAFLATVLGLATSLVAVDSANAATINLTANYLGSTKSAISRPTAANYTTVFNSTQKLDFGQAVNQTPDWIHWFEVDMRFLGTAAEDFQALVYNVSLQNMVPVHGSSDAGTAIWKSYNPIDGNSGNTLFSANQDGGAITTDLQAMLAQQSDPSNAASSQTGEPAAAAGDQPFPTPLGWFAVSATNFVTTPTASFTPGNGNFYQTFNNGTSANGTAAQFSATPGQLGTVPEPASLALLAVGGLAAARRRRA